jgi:hypothetical protein
LNNPKNWIVGSKREFLNTPELQDKAMMSYTEKNYGYAQKYGLLDENTPPEETAGILAGVHLVGAKGYKSSLQGKDVKDANKMRPQQYYDNVLNGYRSMLGRNVPMPMQVAQEDIFQSTIDEPTLGYAP